MKSINLKDSSFSTPSFTLSGMCSDERPALMKWDRLQSSRGPIVYTDQQIGKVTWHPPRANEAIALLIEPPSISDHHYILARRLWRDGWFKRVLSPVAMDQFIHYDLGGSWIHPDLWSCTAYPKTDFCSIIISEKTKAPGHQMRHRAIALFQQLEVYGRGTSRPMVNKIEGLAHFSYSVVIESCRTHGYFSEKLIDCLAVGTIPLYWGDCTIHRLFPGLPVWYTLDQLEEHLLDPPEIAPGLLRAWHETAKHYRCAEDNLMRRRMFQ